MAFGIDDLVMLIGLANSGLNLLNTLFGPPSPPPPPPAPPTLSWEEAMQRATETLTPVYSEQLEKTLENVDKELMARGFYGQLPGDVLKGARATDVERAKAAAIASLGAQMQGQSEQNALAQQQLAAQWALNNMQMQQQKWQSGFGNLMQLLQYPIQYSQATGAMHPWFEKWGWNAGPTYKGLLEYYNANVEPSGYTGYSLSLPGTQQSDWIPRLNLGADYWNNPYK